MRRQPLPLILISLLLHACGGGSSNPPPVAPVFASAPVTAAEEGVGYNYQVVATTSDNSAVTFALTSGPMGASLTGNTVSWTPTHDESRIANSFSVTATSASGGTATQSWSVTPNGTIQIKDLVTYWTPDGPVDVPTQWLPNLPYPAVLIPQRDGSLVRLQGSANPDGSFGIPNVPGGYYWLQIHPLNTYWTSNSEFDAGYDVVGRPIKTAASSATTINYSLSGLDPIQTGDVLTVKTDLRNFGLSFLGTGFRIPNLGPLNATTVSFGETITTDIDFSQISELFFLQYEPAMAGSLNVSALGPALTLQNVKITNGAVNNISGMLQPSPPSSLSLNVKGSAWAGNFANVAPVAAPPLYSSFSVSAQPFVTDRNIVSTGLFSPPNLPLLVPQPPTIFAIIPGFYSCSEFEGPYGNFPLPSAGLPAIVTDQDFGSIPFGDPFPSAWPRVFTYCEQAQVNLPHPNSTLTDTFVITHGQSSTLPTGTVAPLLSPVQNPLVNGGSLFTATTLNTAALTLSWTPPATGQPFGYYVTAYALTTLPSGLTEYVAVGGFATAKTSLTLPQTGTGITYVFVITARADANANVEASPNRSKLPTAFASVVSAPITIGSGATAAAAKASRN